MSQNTRNMFIIGGGIVAALESYYAHRDAHKQGEEISITVYEKGEGFASSNTSCNIVPSLTIDEILSVVPRGSELVQKLAIPFSQPGGIRIDDVLGINDSASAIKFSEAVTRYASDKDHDDRTLSLLMLGKKSMDLWREMYEEGDGELKSILEASNFNPCHETKGVGRVLRDGYRIDLIYGIPNAHLYALNIKNDYERLGYKHCALLSPEEVALLDPNLSDFCQAYSNRKGAWKSNCTALWRPGGCIDTSIFLPKFYAYLKKTIGDRFQLQFNREVIGVEVEDSRIVGLRFKDGTKFEKDGHYLFCPGESVGTLHNLGFDEPPYAGFAGASLLLSIPLSDQERVKYQNFSHCMEVHNLGIVLSWQARLKGDHIFIGVAGTKAFYGDKVPSKCEKFSKNRSLVQLNIMNEVIPELISLAYGYQTHGRKISAEELAFLEEQGIARRWVGRRAVAYDGFPTLGGIYFNRQKVQNARCTTHLGSGGVSFGPGAVFISRGSEEGAKEAFIDTILKYSDSRRIH